jgi:hypothetical protein
MREFAAAGGGGDEGKDLFLFYFSSALGRHVYKSVESESLWRKEEGATAGIRQKKKEKENKIEEGSSHRSSLARRPVILRVARAQHPSLRRARPPFVSHTLLPSLFVLKFF